MIARLQIVVNARSTVLATAAASRHRRRVMRHGESSRRTLGDTAGMRAARSS